MPTYANNRRARFDFRILETLEAGVVLSGQEVKSVKTGGARLTGSFVSIRDGRVILKNAYIAPYRHAGTLATYDPSMDRTLLLNRREIEKWQKKLDTERLTIVPISLYSKAGRVKLELGLAAGKRQFEKRETIKQRELDREQRTRLYTAR